jgi:hypothetical protein
MIHRRSGRSTTIPAQGKLSKFMAVIAIIFGYLLASFSKLPTGPPPGLKLGAGYLLMFGGANYLWTHRKRRKPPVDLN